MEKRNIIVIGASAGGFDALKKLVAALPAGFDAAVFVVWHIAPDVTGVLPQVLAKAGRLPAAHAVDGEALETGRIYVAPPDRHLTVEPGRVRVSKGPKENRFRPAVDPLFRSAAYFYRRRVLGVILSGALDDGTSGLWLVKHFGGAAVVQDPRDAEVPSMPQNALRQVAVDHAVPVGEMGPLLVRLAGEEVETSEVFMEEDKLTELEIKIATEDNSFDLGLMEHGELSPFTCPDCHGVMVRLRDGDRERFRCHTGHAFSADTLLATVTENIEDSLWNAVRGIDEIVMLLNRMGNYYAERGEIRSSVLFFKKAHEAQDRADLVRQAVLRNERLSRDSLREQTDESTGAAAGQSEPDAAAETDAAR